MADFSQWWWQAAAAGPGPGPGPDAGDPMGQSLRFRGSSSLSGHTGGSGTASVWIKRAKLGAAQTVMPGIAFDGSDKLNGSVAVFRDPSAWMHVVVNANGTYVNGVSVASGSAINAGTIGASCELYLAAFYFIDGQALEPTTFGRFNSQGVWVPVDAQGLTYGSNGFKLTFEDPSNIGKDYSPNGNDFSDTGFELANQSSSDYDPMKDSPTQNYATLNPLIPFTNTNVVVQEGNLTTYDRNSTGNVIPSTIPLGGNTQFQWRVASVFGQGPRLGVARANTIQNGGTWWQQNACFCQPDGTITNFGTNEANWVTYAGGDYITIGYSQTENELTFTKNGGDTRVVKLTVTDDLVFFGMNMNNSSGSINFGQQPLRHPIENFDDLQTQNLPTPAILDGRQHFQAITDTGANILTAAQTAFPNGLWWIKDRANSNQHQLVDSVNGQSAVITSPAGSVTAYAAPAGSSVAWCWNAANTDGGFSITDGTHGLGATPAFVIDRALNVWHQSLPAGQGLVLNSTASATSQTWTVDGTTVSGPGGGSYYSWAEIPGYSSFGSYQGNGSISGPCVYLKFRPAFLLIKLTNSSSKVNWVIWDDTRSPYNPSKDVLFPNTTGSEATGTDRWDIDLLSNGFKIRNGNTEQNTTPNNGTYVYAAFASCPFQSPATAR